VIRVFIGYDEREAVAANVFASSIQRRSSVPVAITSIVLEQLSVFTRKPDPLQSTAFSFSRFLTPYLCNYEGWALFADCDMLMLDDIASLWELRDERYAVQVVKHEHAPTETTKFLGAVQTKYEKKNWSSLMLMNCGKCKALTPEYVNTASGLELHQFKWLGDDGLIGALPAQWNHLVGYDDYRPDAPNASLLHYTTGGPWFREYEDTDFAAEWFKERDAMLRSSPRLKVAA
jgi:lipopolysaccharide biosynthesis glycosyltransferase